MHRSNDEVVYCCVRLLFIISTLHPPMSVFCAEMLEEKTAKSIVVVVEYDIFDLRFANIFSSIISLLFVALVAQTRQMPTIHYVPRHQSKNCPCLPPWGGGGISTATNGDNDYADDNDDNYDATTSGGDAPRLMDTKPSVDRSKNRTRTRNPWAKEEQDLFLSGLEQFGKDWKKIATLVKSRTYEQVRSHAHHHASRTKKNSFDGILFSDTLVDVPPQPLILKNAKRIYDDNTRRRPVRAGSSKYTGVCRDKSVGKWKAQIMVDGRVRSIGYYNIEEDAARDYAKAAFKYKAISTHTDDTYGGLVDLSGIPEQPLITNHSIPSGYTGVRLRKTGKWEARISSDKQRFILGCFDTPEEAASSYARAAFCLERMKSEVNEV